MAEIAMYRVDEGWIIQCDGENKPPIAGLQDAVQAVYQLGLERENACADALDRLWKELILARRPDYGDWEYPGQAYRHLKAEIEELQKVQHLAANEIPEQLLELVTAVCNPPHEWQGKPAELWRAIVAGLRR